MTIADFRKQVQNIIVERKQYADFVAKRNMDKMLSNQECNKLYYTIRSQEIQLAKDKYANNDTAKLEKEIETNKKILKQKIIQIGLKIKDLVPQYTCKLCGDTGHYQGKKCNCYNKLLSTILTNNAGIKEEILLSYPTFDGVKFDSYKKEEKENIVALYDLMRKYIDELDTTKKFVITISGHTGVGKTSLCGTITKYAIEKGIYTLFTTSVDLNKSMLNYHCALNEDKATILEPYLSCDLLIIDDLGTEPMLKNVTKEYLYMILTSRISKGLHTIINTNLDPDYLLSHYEERIFSRLCAKNNAVILNMQAHDLRLNKK